MGRLATLSEEIMQVAQPPKIPEDDVYRQALSFLRDGNMPSGAKWLDGPPRLHVKLGGVETCTLRRVSQEATSDFLGPGTVFSCRFSVRPARGESAGIGIDDRAPGSFMSQALDMPCDDHLALQRLGAAMRVVVEERLDTIRMSIRTKMWEDGLWRIVGWSQRDRWVMSDLSIGRVDLGEALVDRNRGESWPSERWDIWVPFTMDVTATLWRKK